MHLYSLNFINQQKSYAPPFSQVSNNIGRIILIPLVYMIKIKFSYKLEKCNLSVQDSGFSRRICKNALSSLKLTSILYCNSDFQNMAHSQFGKPAFWDERYMERKEAFDWYQTWSGIKDIITQYIKPGAKILNVGCGNSRMSEEMYAEGYTDITNIDISPYVIEDMREKYAETDMVFDVMDVKNMHYDDEEFDTVIDKGLLDCILCGDRSSIMAGRALGHIHRVLKRQGFYIMITYGEPDSRLRFLDNGNYTWQIRTYSVAKPVLSNTFSLAIEKPDTPGVHYIYICTKG